MLKFNLISGAVVLAAIAGLCFYAYSQTYEVKQARVDFALREFTGQAHGLISSDTAAVEYLYPKLIPVVLAEQARREAAYIKSLPTWSPLKAAWPEWETFVNAHPAE